VRIAADPRNLIRFVPAKGVHDATSVPDHLEVRVRMSRPGPGYGSQLRAVIVADGRLDEARVRQEAALPSTLVLGADGGAGRAHRAGVRVDLVVGDLDSIDAAVLDELAATGSEVRRAGEDKDESDTELALLAALDLGARSIVLLGALGGERIDHELANLLLLAHPRLDGRDAAIVDGGTTIVRIGNDQGGGTIELAGSAGDLVTLLPFTGPVEGVTTHGLRYPLRGEVLVPGPARGLSNELLGRSARVTTSRGRLLVIHTRRKEAT
jgi:thiamine pyrophosphokinase